VLDTEVAMTIGTVHFVVPFAVLTLYPVARAVPRELLDVSLTLGVKPVATLWHVFLPMCRSGLIAASIIALAMALSAFVNAQFLGGERNLVLTTLVSQLINTFNPTLAAAASAVLVVLGLVLVGAYGRILARLETRRA
jgi:putative spermidine/putrescine transport system permease protein